MFRVFFAVCCGALLFAGSGSAATITFSENLAKSDTTLENGDWATDLNGDFDFGEGLTGELLVNRNGTFGPIRAQVYDSALGGGLDPDLEGPVEFGGSATYDGGNVLIIPSIGSTEADPDDSASGGMVTFLFDALVHFTGITVIDAESPDQWIRIIAGDYDSGEVFNADGTYSILGGFSAWTTQIDVYFGGSGAIDNLKVSAIPLPGAGLLLLAGVGGLAGLRRRRGD